MKIIICPGIHEPELTTSFITGGLNLEHDRSSQQNLVDILVFPEEGILALSAFHILQFLRLHLQRPADESLGNGLETPVIFISFSAGVVGAIIAATKWQLLGGYVKAFIAIDGWGMPLWGNFPIHRLSHDYFTHWSSAVLGSGQDNFYADPPVEHLSMWRSPQTVQGQWVDQSMGFSPSIKSLSAAEFLHLLLKRYD
ncbi:hypothetical protein [Anabaena lutea]|uniref:Alpha/beta hydrolase n=1 Tax=Anabaena lutea FACHB-196 TaxID=2692881 RepID=A0ABR8FGD2_9NOST|nr:hypothetical protein [Anabaena lutea]MBD2569058.1 hypothetical protein [Anabaena lutea FACHB-196]